MSLNVTVKLPTEAAAGPRATLRLHGPLGVVQAEQLRQVAREILASPPGPVRLDWRGAEALSAAALQVLLALETDLKAGGRGLEPGPASEAVRKTLRLCGLERLATAAKGKTRKKEAGEEQDSVANGARG